MNNLIIKAIIILTTFQSPAFAENYNNECLDLRDFKPHRVITLPPRIGDPRIDPFLFHRDFNKSNELDQTQNEIVATVMTYIKKIIDIKFQMTTYLQENKEIYGRYESLRVQKAELDLRMDAHLEERKELLAHYDREVKLIDTDLSESERKRIYKNLIKQRKAALKSVDSKISELSHTKRKVDPKYFDALAQWSPYKEYLTQLENLEKSLLASLKILASVVGQKVPEVEEIAVDLSLFKVPTINQPRILSRICTKIHSRLIELDDRLQ